MSGYSSPPRHIPDMRDRDVPAEYRQHWTEHVAKKPDPVARGGESVVLFRIGIEWMALPTSLFQGIAEESLMHSLPHQRDSMVLGVTNVRGDLIVCISLGVLLGNTLGTPAKSRFILIGTARGALAFPVDEVHGTFRYNSSDLLEVPSTLASARTRYTTGLLAWENRSVARLDEGLILAAIDRALA